MTYSIVARDPATGDFGVAVQSHYLSVGSVCPWARAGVGVVATQSLVEPSYGPLGLDLMAAGKSAAEALTALKAADPGEAVRQVAMVDRAGTVAAHTGGRCIAEAGHRTGDGYSVQANMMGKATVWDAMAAAFEAGVGQGLDLADRLLAALDGAEAEGGDIRGRQSAALLVVKAEGTGRPWHDTLFDLRVEDHPEPLAELRRLVGLKRAYTNSDRGDEAAAQGDFDAALEHYRRSAEVAGDNPELAFWCGVGLAAAGRVDEARRMLDLAFAVHDGWPELLRRLPAAGLFPDDPALLDALLA